MLVIYLVPSGVFAAHGGGWHGGNGGWHRHGGGPVFFNFNGGFPNDYYPGYYYGPYNTCRWIPGYYDDYGYWVQAYRVCY